MDKPTLYKWHEGDPDIIRDNAFESFSSGSFKLNGTNIEFRLCLKPVSEYNQDYCALYLRVFKWDGETSVTLQFRLWIENAIGEKLLEKPSELTHKFTHGDNEDIGDSSFILRDHLLSPDFDFEKYNSITFCCESLRIKPDAGFLVALKFHEKTQSLFEAGITGDCVLKTNNQNFKVPKNLLMASSRIFERKFTSKKKDAKSGIVKIEGTGNEIVEKFIKYLKLGSLDEVDQFAEDLFIFANRYAVGSLKEHCIKRLSETFNKDNIVHRLKIAFECKDVELKNHALFYVTNYGVEGNFRNILESIEWKKLIREKPELANEIILAYFSGTKSL